MTKKLKLSDDEICKKYLNGMNTIELAKEYGCSYVTINNRLRKNKIKIRSNSESHKGRQTENNNHQYIELPIEEICKKYLTGISIHDIAEEYKCSDYTINDRLRKNKIKIRSKSETTILRQSNKTNIIKYFCRVCNTLLTDITWTKSRQQRHEYICKRCSNDHYRLYRTKNRDKINNQANERNTHTINRESHNKRSRDRSYINGTTPMDKNKKCAAFLGVYIGEGLLSQLFNNVIRMPYGNKGYDFICANNYKIDCKTGCRISVNGRPDQWIFQIRKNIIPDYFLLMAFDNREAINPEHIWLIPGNMINNKSGVGISTTTIKKWLKYEKIDLLNTAKSICNLSNIV